MDYIRERTFRVMNFEHDGGVYRIGATTNDGIWRQRADGQWDRCDTAESALVHHAWLRSRGVTSC